MDEEFEKSQMLRDVLLDLTRLSYEELRNSLLFEPWEMVDYHIRRVTVPSGGSYDVEIQAYWEDEERPDQDLRVVVSLEDGDLYDFFIIQPDGRYFIGGIDDDAEAQTSIPRVPK
jgi:hypothetical protein